MFDRAKMLPSLILQPQIKASLSLNAIAVLKKRYVGLRLDPDAIQNSKPPTS